MRCVLFLVALVAVAAGAQAFATLVQFEFAPPGAELNLDPMTPHLELGFVFTPLDSDSAIFDRTAPHTMPGNDSDFLGFDEGNVIAITTSDQEPFTLFEVDLGRNTYASSSAVNITLVGTRIDGSTLSATFPGISTVTHAVFNWPDLRRVAIFASDDAAIDNVSVVPEPSAGCLLSFGCFVARCRRRFAQKSGVSS